MTDAFLWHMTGADRAALIGLARSIILWDKTVAIIDGTEPDYRIRMAANSSPSVAHALAIVETEKAEEMGLAVKSVFGCRNMNGGFATNMAMAHRLYLLNYEKELEGVLRDIVFLIQRDGEQLYG